MGRYDGKKKAISAFLALLMAAGMSVGCASRRTGDTSPSNTESATAPSVTETAVTTQETEPAEETLSQEESVSILLSEICSDLTGETIDPVSRSDDAAFVAGGTVSINDSICSFISSSYFETLGLTDDEFVRRCHLTFKGETAGEYTVRFLTGLMTDGRTRCDVASLLMEDPYFAERCSTYGVLPSFELDSISEISDWYDVINDIGDTTEVLTLGRMIPLESDLELLYTAMDELTENSRDFGFMLLDMDTGEGLVYNIDQVFYTASAIKGPFAASFACNDPEGAQNWEATVTNMLVNSDNDAYTALNNTYRRVYIQQWCEEIGIDPDPFRYKYPHISTRQLTALWVRSYQFFEEDEFGPVAGAWFEEPVYSLIHSELGELYVTRSKAGWLVDDDPSHTTTVDGGIVYATNGPYVVVIMSRVPRDIEPLRPLMRALESYHCSL